MRPGTGVSSAQAAAASAQAERVAKVRQALLADQVAAEADIRKILQHRRQLSLKAIAPFSDGDARGEATCFDQALTRFGKPVASVTELTIELFESQAQAHLSRLRLVAAGKRRRAATRRSCREGPPR